jgi:hypothetical protein
MLNLKKTAVAVLAFGSSAVFAGTMGPVCVPGNVTVPCEASAWDFGGYALYLNPTYAGPMAYVGTYQTESQVVADPFTTNTNNLNNVKRAQPWNWGFKLEGSYHYGMGNDVNLNWYHYSNKSNFAYTDGIANITTPDPLDTNAVAATQKPQWDAVNLEFGQHVDFTEASKIRFHAGAQYGRVNTSESGVYANNVGGVDPSVDAVVGAYSNSSTYNGFGPRTGADLSYAFGNGLSLYGNGAATLLVGKSKFSTAHADSTIDTIVDGVPTAFTNKGSTTYGSATAVVPELEAKLGAMYTCAMASGDLTFDAGYMWVNYFNVQTTDKVGAFNAATAGDQNDFALNGVYFGMNWRGNLG